MRIGMSGRLFGVVPWRVLIGWMLALLPFAWSGVEAASIQKAARHALVIGNSNYAFVPALPNVNNDRADMCKALVQLRFKVTCLQDLSTREELLSAVENFVSTTPPGAMVMLYYGGHAIQVAGENYLIPTQISKGDSLHQFVRLSEIFDITEQRQSGFRFIVLDACRNDPDAPIPASMIAGTSQATGVRNLRALMQSVRGGGRYAATYGIAAIRDAPASTTVLFGTGAGSVAFDDSDNQRNGPLTKHLLSEIQVDRQSITQAIENVIRRVGEETERLYMKRQSAVMYGTPGSSFCFVGCAKEKGANVLFTGQ
jgi:hypothetical protein